MLNLKDFIFRNIEIHYLIKYENYIWERKAEIYNSNHFDIFYDNIDLFNCQGLLI